MRAGVKPRRFELGADFGKRLPSGVSYRQTAASDLSIDVEHPEAYGLHVKGMNGDSEGRTFFEEAVASGTRWLGLDFAHQRLQFVLGGLSVIDSCHNSLRGVSFP